MSQKSSLLQSPEFVSKVLMADKRHALRTGPAKQRVRTVKRRQLV
jgi:hypothetical protein